MKKTKRVVRVTNQPDAQTLQDLGTIYLTALIVLEGVQVPESAEKFIRDAIDLFGLTVVDIQNKHVALTGKSVEVSHLDKAFSFLEVTHGEN